MGRTLVQPCMATWHSSPASWPQPEPPPRWCWLWRTQMTRSTAQAASSPLRRSPPPPPSSWPPLPRGRPGDAPPATGVQGPPLQPQCCLPPPPGMWLLLGDHMLTELSGASNTGHSHGLSPKPKPAPSLGVGSRPCALGSKSLARPTASATTATRSLARNAAGLSKCHIASCLVDGKGAWTSGMRPKSCLYYALSGHLAVLYLMSLTSHHLCDPT